MAAAPGCPCHGCSKRSIGCHGTCCGYLEWSKVQEELRKKRNAATINDMWGSDWMDRNYAKKRH